MRSCKQLDANLRVVYGLIINTLPSDNSGGAGLDALTVLQVEHDKIATTFEDTAAIEANAGEADETPTAQRAQAEAVLADAQAYLTATEPQMKTEDANETPPAPQPEAAPRPVEIEQMRCVGCRELYPADQVTYHTGLCQACLAHQLNQLAADYHMMRAVFAVLDRRLMSDLAAELKRDIYEEMHAPHDNTPESEPDVLTFAPASDDEPVAALIATAAPKMQPEERITCDECKKTFPPDQITQYNGRNLHTDCYYAEMTTALKAHNAETAQIADDLSENMPDPRERVLYHKQQGLSVRKIADALKAEGITMSKSAVDRILQEQKEAEPW